MEKPFVDTNIAPVCTPKEGMTEQDLEGSEGGLHEREKAPFIDHIARLRPGAKREGGGGGR